MTFRDLYTTDPIHAIARACYEVNRAYCKGIGDDSFPPWEDAADWQKAPNLAGVRYLIDHPNATPAEMHESWLNQKRSDGWKYGPIKDPAKLEHPAFLPYDELPQEQKIKDHLFGAVVRSML